MSSEQQTAFNLSLTGELGGSRVTCGGVGVVALALSVLFEQIFQQVRGSTEGRLSTQRSQANKIFGISSSSRIGWIIQDYLRLVPGIANNQDKMAETTELYDNWLKRELLDHYERMTTKKRMSSVSMQQWLTGAAVHLHMRIHQVRLHSVPFGSAESLRLSYKSSLAGLVQDYANYLRRNIKETGAPRLRKPKTRTNSGPRQTRANISSLTNSSCSSYRLLNVSLVSPSNSTDRFNETITPNSTAEMSRICKTGTSNEDFGLNVTEGGDETTVGMMSRKTLNVSTAYSRDEGAGMLGLLVIEPLRNVSHNVRHHPCESPAIQQALVSRIINAQDLDRNRNFFLYPEKVIHNLLRQNDDFELKTA
ncbi:uncharacterized protein LOC121910596 [Thunnus maccoyii]|uniref:uncharacterized protein LOC121910596 n=1 Tax=Thunnus maccoyii TaxID=8240 RepID=UPI001C4D3DBC|nr:uncharacterized protein LOC121910596 [Thunnus maccoyii]XP_042287781.1 uncharacterized protein LOC121910596 [Thunnus maccoyii]